MIIVLFVIATGWPLAPQDSTQPLGNNWGEYQYYGGWPYMHPGIDVMGITIGKPVYAVQSGIVKAWLTTSGQWHWRLAIADYDTNDSVEAWLYAHIDPNRFHKNVGESISEGELIGYLVEWPVTGFDHLHFARIKDEGPIWQVGDWAFIQNPLVIIEPYDDTAKPVFEDAYGSNLFAFCWNNTSSYLQPDSLFGSVDIIAKIYDKTGLRLPYSEWEKLIPYKIEYEIHGSQNMPTMLSFIFYGVLDPYNNVDVIYKDDAICNSRGDYEYRDYYFIVTNTDGDSVIESSDAAYSWVTTNFPDGDYWVVVTAYDPTGNFKKDSMLVTINNLGVEEKQETRAKIQEPSITITPNPNQGSFYIDSPVTVKIIDVSGRLVKSGQGRFNGLLPGIYFVQIENDKYYFCEKLIVIKDN